jgi:hypothetical protein
MLARLVTPGHYHLPQATSSMHLFPGSEQKIIFSNVIPGKQRNLKY